MPISRFAAGLKRKLQDEGFPHVYAWTDKPNTPYPKHKHRGKVTFYVTKGSITMMFTRHKKTLKRGDRIDVPAGVFHSGRVGPSGCSCVVGEQIKGDSE